MENTNQHDPIGIKWPLSETELFDMTVDEISAIHERAKISKNECLIDMQAHFSRKAKNIFLNEVLWKYVHAMEWEAIVRTVQAVSKDRANRNREAV